MNAAGAAYRAIGWLLRPGLEGWGRLAGPERAARAGLAAPEPRGALWAHAASVGELGGVEVFLGALHSRAPGLPARITCHTRTGLARARAGGRVAEPAPLDAAFAVGRRLARTRPAALAVFETELWPALLGECAVRVPVSWVNGRISERAFPRHRALRSLLAPSLARVRAFAVQGPADAERFVALGAPAERVRVTGNLKHDRPPPPRISGADLGLAGDGPVVVFGSLRDGEEAAVLDALAVARRAEPALAAVLAPRHPRVAERLAGLLRERGVDFGRRSAGASGVRTLLLDTLGELAGAYTAGQVAFVGGSLVPLGGHDVMEPARAGVPVLFGPHTGHCDVECRALLDSGGALRVPDGAALGRAMAELLAAPAERARMAAAAAAAAAAERGSAARALDWLLRNGALPAGPAPEAA
ncbi:MAG: 3-deoxy-D-manno-octulosonic acid transferase [Candidatus Eisenbacteria bacterium]|nr:3-deoxy-D-manno-octulosonic acid transferase [Candidatus Eisenbacteria bacterium]